jgi:hypothetical protein
MADRVVVNCDAQLAAALFREADEWRAKGDLVNEQAALDTARSQLEAAGLDSREAAEAKAVERVPLTAAEKQQQDADAVEAANRAEAEAAAQEERRQLVDKLTSGRATATEVQQALATLLGGGTPTQRP